ncbi:MAG TPA: helix-turn-helix transcriptional regulator [Rickettsiales bacterium]|nr:helix-turn-helix transcriptional regulator [Rickettsiales bacterium]
MRKKNTNALGQFLRAMRERLKPEDFGLPAGGRRRAPGLRREEAASLCGVSPTWFTWIEQGRTTGVSQGTLQAIARGLRMSQAERAYLYTLGMRSEPARPAAADKAPHQLLPLVQAMKHPVYILDRYWDAVVWNSAAASLFSGWLGKKNERNLLRYVFLATDARKFIADWRGRSQRLVAEYRADTAGLREDPVRRAMVEELSEQSAAFAEAWKSQLVLAREGGIRQFNHPKRGTLRYEQFTLRPAAFPELKLIALVPL